MMRLRSLALTALGLCTLGTLGIGLGVTALARPRGPAPRPVPAPALQPAPARSWSRILPGGGPTVTLVGLTPGGAEPRAWTDPDGRPLAAPYARPGFLLYPQEDQRAWELALRFPDPEKRLGWRCRTVPSGGANAAGYPPADDSGRSRDDDLKAFGVCLPRPDRSLTLRFEVAHRPWRTLRVCPTAGSQAAGPGGDGKPAVIFGTALRVGERTALTVTHDVREDDVRLVAVDPRGAEHTAARVSSYAAGALSQIEVQFSLSPSEIREFRLQSRPFDAVTFEDIPLPSRAGAAK